MPDIKIGTRPSQLAVKQAQMVSERIRTAGIQSELIRISSAGDADNQTPLYISSGSGMFVGEINRMVDDGSLDLAVHSAKDIPADLPESLGIVSILPRGSFHDVFVSNFTLQTVPPGSSIGTSSMRRIRELRMVRPDLKSENIRGNIDTRIRKYHEGRYSGVILAEAGLERMGVMEEYERLPVDLFMPAPGQGIIAVVGRRDSYIFKKISVLIHNEAQFALEIEREIMKQLGLGCSMPAGILCQKSGEVFMARVRIYSLKTDTYRDFGSVVRNLDDAVLLADQVRESLPKNFGYNLGGS